MARHTVMLCSMLCVANKPIMPSVVMLNAECHSAVALTKTKVSQQKWHRGRTPGACTIKLFIAVIYGFSEIARVLVSGKLQAFPD
jgi:hypothetical protein